MTRPYDFDDLRDLARKAVPRAVFDYIDGGSYAEETLRRGRAALDAVTLRQRVMVDVSDRSTASRLLGLPASMPLALAPTGLCGLAHGDGELAATRAAAAAGVPFALSTLSVSTIEDVAETGAPFWFQLYLTADRAFSARLIERALAAKASALILTLDVHVRSQRHRDQKNGLTAPAHLTPRNLIAGALHPKWALGVLGAKRRTFGNIDGHVSGVRGLRATTEWIETQFDGAIGPPDIAWVRKLWPGKLILKGILDPDDALMARDLGADAIIVSTHGGRQLDGAATVVDQLPAIRAALGPGFEILADSGVRSGTDILRLLALGADGCLIGRAYLYGLAWRGEAGVTAVIQMLRKELDETMGLAGLRRLDVLAETLSSNATRTAT